MTADAAAAEPVTSNDTTSNDLAGEHVTGDETPREHPLGHHRGRRSLRYRRALSGAAVDRGRASMR